MFNRMSGHFDLEIPDLKGFDWPELVEKAEEIRRLNGERKDAIRTARELEDKRTQAKRADTAAYASALRSGKKDPGTKHTDKLEERIEATARRRDALRAALEASARELLSLIEERRAAWKPEAEDSLAVAEGAAEEARVALERAGAELLRHKQVLAFLEDPENYRPGKVAKEAQKTPSSPKPKPKVSLLGVPPRMREAADANAS